MCTCVCTFAECYFLTLRCVSIHMLYANAEYLKKKYKTDERHFNSQIARTQQSVKQMLIVCATCKI